MGRPQNTRTKYDLVEVNRPQRDRQSDSNFLNKIFNNTRRLPDDAALNSKFKAYINPDMSRGPNADPDIAAETREVLETFWGFNNAPDNWFLYPNTPNLDEATEPEQDPPNNWAGPYAPAPGSPIDKDDLTGTRPEVPEGYVENLPRSDGYYPIATASDYRGNTGEERRSQQREVIVNVHENSIREE